jgi:mannose-6-phosphate isomerase-like protein (cupin superfamily)
MMSHYGAEEDEHMTTAPATTQPAGMWVIGHRVTPLRAGGRVMALEVVSPPGVPGPPPHHHEDCAEFFFVTRGRVAVTRGDESLLLGEGDYAEVPRGVIHTFANAGDTDSHVITGFEPSGFEAFFDHFGVDAAEPGAFEASVSDEMITRVIAECSRFGMILAPPNDGR